MENEIFGRVVIVEASHSQFWLSWDNAPAADGVSVHHLGLGLVTFMADPPMMILTSPVQDGDLEVRVGLHRVRPPALGHEWPDVVEVSLGPVSELTLAGLGYGTGWRTVMPLGSREPRRVRYALPALDDGGSRNGPLTGYRIDVWSEPLSPPRIVAESQFGRWASREHRIETARLDATQVSGDEITRFRAFIRALLDLDPEIEDALRLRNGPWRTSVLSRQVDLWGGPLRVLEQGEKSAILDAELDS